MTNEDWLRERLGNEPVIAELAETPVPEDLFLSIRTYTELSEAVRYLDEYNLDNAKQIHNVFRKLWERGKVPRKEPGTRPESDLLPMLEDRLGKEFLEDPAIAFQIQDFGSALSASVTFYRHMKIFEAALRGERIRDIDMCLESAKYRLGEMAPAMTTFFMAKQQEPYKFLEGLFALESALASSRIESDNSENVIEYLTDFVDYLKQPSPGNGNVYSFPSSTWNNHPAT